MTGGPISFSLRTFCSVDRPAIRVILAERMIQRLLALCLLAIGPASGAEIVKHITVYRDDTLYHISPWLARLKNGELVVTMREAHKRPKALRGHVDPTARGVLVRSSDGGQTWGEKVVVDDETWRFSTTQDVPFTQLADGSLLLNMYSWTVAMLPIGFHRPESPDAVTKPWSPVLEGLSLLRSSDNGRTWSPRQRIQMPGYSGLVARSPAVELPDGTLLLSVGYRPLVSVPGRGQREYPYTDHLIRSTDKGKTWSPPMEIAADPEHEVHYVESGFVRLRSGKLIIMHRTESYLQQSESTDDGKTWTKPRKTPMWGWVSHLLELRDGRILCTYGYRRAPFGVRGCLSNDGGKTWDIANEIVLRDDGGTSDLGYPSSVEFDDGRVLTVYWMNHEKAGDSRSETRYIAGTFFKP